MKKFEARPGAIADETRAKKRGECVRASAKMRASMGAAREGRLKPIVCTQVRAG
jgi:hypothetical protein